MEGVQLAAPFRPARPAGSDPGDHPLKKAARLTARGARPGGACPSSIQNGEGEGPARRPARPGAGRPAQEKEAARRRTCPGSSPLVAGAGPAPAP